MKSFRTFWLVLLLIPFIAVRSQNSISLQVDPALASINIGDLLISNDLTGQARYFKIFITTDPPGKRIYLEGSIDWKFSDSPNYQRLYSFTSKVFNAKNITNDDIGNPDIGKAQDHLDSDLKDDMIKKGKLSGFLKFSVTMYSEDGTSLGSDSDLIELVNPAQTLSIILPTNNSNVDVGNVQMSWTSIQGVLRYEVLAVVVPENNPSLDEALSSQTPIVDEKNIMSINVNLSQLKTRDWFDGQKIVAVVKAIYLESGKEVELRSDPVVFFLGQGTTSGGSGGTLQPDANMIRLANIVGDKVPGDILTKLKDGTIKLDQVQCEDENGQPVSSDNFLIILGLLEQKNPSDLIIKYTSKQ